MKKKKSVAVVGLGYVGLPLALLVKEKGFNVIGIEKSTARTNLINSGSSPFIDDEITEKLKGLGLEATTDFKGVKKCDIAIICVPTPVDAENNPDLTPVIEAATETAKNLSKGKLIIIESTINPGVCEEVVIPIIEESSGLKCGEDFLLAHCPERINPGDEKWHVGNIPRVVGGYDKDSLEIAAAFYESIIDAPIKKMSSLKEAEAVKVVENSFRDVNIAFVNELARSFHTLGIDTVNVIDGAATKPFAFMPHYPGIGVGGHCIPVDPYYLIEYAKKHGFTHHFLQTARKINENMPEFTVELLKDGLRKSGKSLEKAKVILLGLAYKPEVGDLRESPALEIMKILKKNDVNFEVFDPYVKEVEDAQFISNHKEISDSHSLVEALKHADAIVIATSHKIIKNMDIKQLANTSLKLILDGRNCLDKELVKSNGIEYVGIGR